MSNYETYALTDEEREAGIGALLAGYYDNDVEEEEQLRDRNVEIATEIFESEFTIYANRKKAHLRRISNLPIPNTVNRAITFEFLLSYFKKFAISRYMRENKINKEFALLAQNHNCPQIIFSNYIITCTEELVLPSDLDNLSAIIKESNGRTAYYRTQAIRNLLVKKETPETKKTLNSLRTTLGTLRLFFLLNEIGLFKYKDPSGQKEFFRLHLAHKQELEMEWLYPECPGQRRKYFNLQPLLYFYPPLVRQFYSDYHLKDNRKSFTDYRDQILPFVKEFYSLYYKSPNQWYYSTRTQSSTNENSGELPL